MTAQTLEEALERIATAACGFVVGNGRSRLGLDLEALRKRGVVAGCNGLFWDFLPDLLVSLDPGMTREILEANPPCCHLFEHGRFEFDGPPPPQLRLPEVTEERQTRGSFMGNFGRQWPTSSFGGSSGHIAGQLLCEM